MMEISLNIRERVNFD